LKGRRLKTRIAALTCLLLCGVAKADQLPAPPTMEQQICAKALEMVPQALKGAMDNYYFMGIRDRDELEKKMIEASRDALKQESALCPFGTLTPKAIDDMAYSIIAARFGAFRPPSSPEPQEEKCKQDVTAIRQNLETGLDYYTAQGIKDRTELAAAMIKLARWKINQYTKDQCSNDISSMVSQMAQEIIALSNK
jgi:hypothetical protein